MPDLYRQDELDNMMYEEARKERERQYAEYERTHDEQRKALLKSMHDSAKKTVFVEPDSKDPDRAKKLLVSMMMLVSFTQNLRDTGDIYGRDPLKCD